MTSVPEPAVDDLALARREIEALRRQLIEERERALHAVDGQRGAEAVAAQAQADVRELSYRLHVREAELRQLQEVLERLGVGNVEPGPSSSPARSAPSAVGADERLLRQSASAMIDRASRVGRQARSGLLQLRAAARTRVTEDSP